MHIFLVDSEIWPNLILKQKKKKFLLALIKCKNNKKNFKKMDVNFKKLQKKFLVLLIYVFIK